jgi:hypothetical protein
MAFSLIAADEMCPVRDHEKGELALMECAPPSRVADHVRSPRKRHHRFLEPIDSVVAATTRQLDATFMNRSPDMWPQRETLSSAVRAVAPEGAAPNFDHLYQLRAISYEAK